MIVKVADRFKQPLQNVLLDPFAITLWSYLQIMRLEREELIQKMQDRLENAGLITSGFHDPQTLKKYELEYLRQAGLLKKVIDSARDRAAKMIEEHKKLQTVAVVQPMKSGDTTVRKP